MTQNPNTRNGPVDVAGPKTMSGDAGSRRSPPTALDVAVIGAGFFGCCVAEFMAKGGARVLLLEREPHIMQRATRNNQARIHAGYHYPRSFLTALRSFHNYPRFVDEFRDAVVDNFTMLYCVARRQSKVSARRFFQMFQKMGAPLEPAPPRYCGLFDEAEVEAVFVARECAYDPTILKRLMEERLAAAGVQLACGVDVAAIAGVDDGGIDLLGPDGSPICRAQRAFNCTYANVNALLRRSDLPTLPLKHELAEMPLVELPDELKNLAITVMDGPFFSVFPYPPRGLHSVHHVRYTPHMSWTDNDADFDGNELLARPRLQSNFPYMRRSIARYSPALGEMQMIDSICEIKTVLVKNEIDDGRPILFKPDWGIPNFDVILGAKIDNIYDVLDAIRENRAGTRAETPLAPALSSATRSSASPDGRRPNDPV